MKPLELVLSGPLLRPKWLGPCLVEFLTLSKDGGSTASLGSLLQCHSH